MLTLDKSIKQINGPVNVVRLEGTINGIKKVIYLFMDMHYRIQNETECNNIYAKDINQYLVDNFEKLNNSDKIYDFYLETYPPLIPTKPPIINYRDTYLAETINFFNKIFKYDTSKNRVSSPENFKNIRIHYTDIRNFFKRYHHQSMFDIRSNVDRMWQNLNYSQRDFEMIIYILSDFKNTCMLISDILNGRYKPKVNPKINIITDESKLPKQQTPEELFELDVQYINYLINKMFHKYNHKNVQKKLLEYVDIINSNTTSIIKDCDEMINFCKTHLKILSEVPQFVKHRVKFFDNHYEYNYGLSMYEIRDTLNRLHEREENLYNKFISYFVEFMDVFFLRRFLDKDYVTNAIVYTGQYHSQVYIKVLVKDFGFKITHASYSSITDLKKLNEEIVKKDAFEISEFFVPPIQSQCSDVTNFPENFL